MFRQELYWLGMNAKGWILAALLCLAAGCGDDSQEDQSANQGGKNSLSAPESFKAKSDVGVGNLSRLGADKSAGRGYGAAHPDDNENDGRSAFEKAARTSISELSPDMTQEASGKPASPEAGEEKEREGFRNMPLEEFKRLGSWRRFLLKHRIGHPDEAVAATSTGVVAGLYPVQIWVELVGTVTSHHPHRRRDGDYVFNVGKLHLEITPGHQMQGFPFGHSIHFPKTGETVRIRGWTYYDVRDEDDANEDGQPHESGWWEIHPVTYVEVISPSNPQ